MKLIREQDDFDWVRDIPIDIPFTNLEIGKLYRIETTEVLREALVACSKSERLLHAYMGIPAMKSKDEYNQIFCDHEREDRVDSVYLEFYDTENSNLQEAIGNSIKDLVFLILYKRSPYLGHAFEHLSSRALDAILTNNYTEYEKIKEDRRILYFNEILPKYQST